LLSLHGFSGFSCEINFLILARMAVEDISVPSGCLDVTGKEIPESKTPRGVCMYVAVVTRELSIRAFPRLRRRPLRMSGFHRFLPQFEKTCLPLHDAARHLDQGLVANLEGVRISQARLLQLRAAAWRDRGKREIKIGVSAIDADPRQPWPG